MILAAQLAIGAALLTAALAIVRNAALAPRARRPTALAVLTGTVWSVAWFSALGADAIPGWALLPSQEGLTHHTLNEIVGLGAHAGAAFGLVVEAYSQLDPTPVPLRAAVAMNVWLSGLGVLVFLSIAWGVTRRWGQALGFALLYAVSLPFVHGALASGAAATLNLLVLLGAAALLSDAARPGDSPSPHPLTAVAVIALGALAAAVRTEFAVLPAFAALAWSARLPAVAQLGARARDAAHAALSRDWRAPALALVVVGVAAHVMPAIVGSYGVQALWPAEVSVLSLPGVLSRGTSPVLVALFLLGSWHALVRFPRFAGVPLATLALFKAYFAASHQGSAGEMDRYAANLLALVGVAALFGPLQLSALAQRWQWPSGWRAAAWLVAGLLLVPTPAVVAHQRAIPKHTDDPGAIARGALGFGNMQAEVEFLVTLADADPTCALVARVTEGQATSLGSSATLRLDHAIIIQPSTRHSSLHPVPDGPIDVASLPLADAACVWVYHGLDCALRLDDSPACVAPTRFTESRAAEISAPSYYGHLRYPTPATVVAYRVR